MSTKWHGHDLTTVSGAIHAHRDMVMTRDILYAVGNEIWIWYGIWCHLARRSDPGERFCNGVFGIINFATMVSATSVEFDYWRKTSDLDFDIRKLAKPLCTRLGPSETRYFEDNLLQNSYWARGDLGVSITAGILNLLWIWQPVLIAFLQLPPKPTSSPPPKPTSSPSEPFDTDDGAALPATPSESPFFDTATSTLFFTNIGICLLNLGMTGYAIAKNIALEYDEPVAVCHLAYPISDNPNHTPESISRLDGIKEASDVALVSNFLLLIFWQSRGVYVPATCDMQYPDSNERPPCYMLGHSLAGGLDTLFNFISSGHLIYANAQSIELYKNDLN